MEFIYDEGKFSNGTILHFKTQSGLIPKNATFAPSAGNEPNSGNELGDHPSLGFESGFELGFLTTK